MINIAVLGCGRIGVMHADNIVTNPRARLAGVYDIYAQAAQDCAQKHGVTCYSNAEEIFADDAVDAVLIATATATHSDYIEAAVAAGKPVLCEKPIDLDMARVELCQTRINGSDVPIMLGFCRRFDPSHRSARDALNNGEIGDLHQVIITSRDPDMAPDAYIESSGGIFRDMTIHDFDLARFFLGEEVTNVTAHGSRLVNPELMARCNDFDTVVVTLGTASGKQAVITNSRRAVYGYDQRVELFGSTGMVISENHTKTKISRHGADATQVSPPLKSFFIDRYNDAFHAEIESFVDVVEGTASVEVGFDDGRIALQLADAAFRSISEGRTISV